ncbi:hypothetical protein QCA50_008466 [Cerrena zonata]|uniref:Uncharacterized protein n=1 Tax=Cerrena zonata TaxID=2478898 RepID=A0AAW0GES2_9APHY
MRDEDVLERYSSFLFLVTNTMKFLSVALVSISTVATVNGATVEFFVNKACDSASESFRGNCNFCADPPFDWGAVRFSDIPADSRVTIHNQDGCTSASQVGQGFGPSCWLQGATKLRSAFVACPGDRAASANMTLDAEEAHE